MLPFLRVLACPKCKGELGIENDYLMCEKCRLKYPVIDNIPRFLDTDAVKY